MNNIKSRTDNPQNLNRHRIQEIQRKIDKLNNVKDKGFVYLLVSDNYPGWVKVGVTTDLEHRLAVYRSHSPDSSFKYIKTKRSDYKKKVELLCVLSFNKLCQQAHKREWFKFDDKQDPAAVVEINANREITFLDLYDYRELYEKSNHFAA